MPSETSKTVLVLTLAFAILIALLIGTGYLGLSRMNQINTTLNDVLGNHWNKLQLSRQALALSSRNSFVVMEILLLEDKRMIDPLVRNRAENTKQISALLAEIDSMCDTREEKLSLAAIEKARIQYVTSYERVLGLPDELRKAGTTGDLIANETAPALSIYHTAWDNFIRLQMEATSRAEEESRERYAATRTLVLVLIILAVSAAGAVAAIVTRKMTRDITARARAEQETRELNTQLEEKVQRRTAALTQLNQELAAVIREHEKVQERLYLRTAALDAAANAIVITDRSGVIVWVNPAFSKLTGYSVEEVVGDNPRVLKSGKHDSRFYADLWGTITAGHVWQGEVTNRRKDGRDYVEEMTITPVRSEAGDVTHFIAIKVDVTERRRAEEAISRSESTLRSLVEGAPFGISRSTFGGRFLNVNPAVCRMLGYNSAAEIVALDLPVVIYFDPDERASAMQKLRQDGLLRNHESVWKRKDGSRIHISVNAHVSDIGASEPVIDSFIEDITARKRAEAALQDRERHFRSLIENALDVIVVTGTDGTLQFVSPSMERNFGHQPESLIGRNVFQYVHPEDRLEAGVALSRVLLEPGAVESLRCRMLHQNGSWRAVEVLGKCISDGMNGQVVVLNARDITERKLAEDELRTSEQKYRTLFTEAGKLQEQLLQSQKLEALGKLAGGVAHDFNNILMIIKSYSDMILDKVDGESSLRRPVEQIRAAGDRATALVRQLLAFSRKELIVPKVLNLDQVLADLKKMLPRLLGEDIKLEVSTTDGLWSVTADPSQIEQIIFNLAVNARDAMPAGGTLAISTSNVELDSEFLSTHPESHVGQFVSLIVSDNGTGISQEVQKRMFEPFYTTKDAGKGTGLGLSTVYGIVKQSHGIITVESEPGRGASFRVYLPRTSEPCIAKEPERLRPAADLRANILLVEDEEPTREAITDYLGENGFRVFAAPGPLEALSLCDQNGHSVDVLLTDIVMPGMHGTELAERIRKHYPKVNVIFMSGYTDDILIRSGIRSDHVNFLLKPFGLPELVAKVNGLLKPKGNVDK